MRLTGLACALPHVFALLLTGGSAHAQLDPESGLSDPESGLDAPEPPSAPKPAPQPSAPKPAPQPSAPTAPAPQPAPAPAPAPAPVITPPPPPPPPPAPASEPRPSAAAPSPSAPASPYLQQVRAGIAETAKRDLTAAKATLRAALQLEAESPSAYCHLGDALLLESSFADARAAYESCAHFASRTPGTRDGARALVGLAQVVELSPGSLEEKRAGWQRLAEGSSEPLAKALGDARAHAYGEAIARLAESQVVKRRIVEREVMREVAEERPPP